MFKIAPTFLFYHSIIISPPYIMNLSPNNRFISQKKKYSTIYVYITFELLCFKYTKCYCVFSPAKNYSQAISNFFFFGRNIFDLRQHNLQGGINFVQYVCLMDGILD